MILLGMCVTLHRENCKLEALIYKSHFMVFSDAMLLYRNCSFR